MPKAKNRDRDRRGTRFPKGKLRSDPWGPVHPLGTVLVTTRRLGAYWGGFGPNTRVVVVAHTPEAPGNYGTGLMVVPVDKGHPFYRKVGADGPSESLGLYVENREIRTHLRPE